MLTESNPQFQETQNTFEQLENGESVHDHGSPNPEDPIVISTQNDNTLPEYVEDNSSDVSSFLSTSSSLCESDTGYELSLDNRRRLSRTRKRCLSEAFDADSSLSDEQTTIRKKPKLVGDNTYDGASSSLSESDVNKKISLAETRVELPKELRGNFKVGISDFISPTIWNERRCALRNEEIHIYSRNDEDCTNSLYVISLRGLDLYAISRDYGANTESLLLRFSQGDYTKVIYLQKENDFDLAAWERQINLIRENAYLQK
ncbi:hypothetical protein GWI33_007573 [Rhynchophorus ferrugineus]|uniref:PH domain-containing protein n=1 Tax=Rhynchophorus ferrugineus TaxID=354439 RepID=A0A834IT05_RHYFE|nr:hypothetical protein GWI33_007573 [Rhynchophorus ferrugineus]